MSDTALATDIGPFITLKGVEGSQEIPRLRLHAESQK